MSSDGPAACSAEQPCKPGVEGSLPRVQGCSHACRNLATGVLDFACEHWFILGVGFAIGFAKALPDFGKNKGWIRAEYTLKYVAVIVIFLLSGLSLKSKVLLQAAQRAHLHLYIQLLCLGLTPLIGYAVTRAMRRSDWLNQDLVSGLVVCTSMPTTISTNVVFTKQAGGNDAVALINAVIGNVIGIFVSPGLLVLYLNQSGQAPYSDVLRQLGITVIAPLIAGQIIQYVWPVHVQALQKRVNFSKVSNIMILLLVWNTFCGTFASNVSAGAGSLVIVIMVCVLLYGTFTLVCFGCSCAIRSLGFLQSWFKLTRPETVAVLMCGATKTLALGMPLISVLYGNQSNVALLALPLIVYHASQILQGNVLIKPLRRWATAEDLPVKQASAADSSDDFSTPTKEADGTAPAALPMVPGACMQAPAHVAGSSSRGHTAEGGGTE